MAQFSEKRLVATHTSNNGPLAVLIESGGEFAGTVPAVAMPLEPLSTCDACIMIVDDEPVNVDLLKVYLQDAGYHRFISTFDSREVFDQVRKHKPDVLMLDLMMPNTSGIDILQWRMSDPVARRRMWRKRARRWKRPIRTKATAPLR